MLDSLNARNGSKSNNAQDILTAVTAHKRGFTLVTCDSDLAAVMREHGGRSVSFDEFMGAAQS